MALPIWMLKDLKISISQKVGLAFIFSLAIVCVALDIVRVIEAVKQIKHFTPLLRSTSLSSFPAYQHTAHFWG